MGLLKRLVDRKGYNPHERAMVYSGVILGSTAPIIGARYLIFPNNSNTALEESVYWIGSLVTNLFLPLFFKKLPLPVYTGVYGTAIGGKLADRSKFNRIKKEFNRKEKESGLEKNKS